MSRLTTEILGSIVAFSQGPPVSVSRKLEVSTGPRAACLYFVGAKLQLPKVFLTQFALAEAISMPELIGPATILLRKFLPRTDTPKAFELSATVSYPSMATSASMATTQEHTTDTNSM
uniref:Uncharacterized protein n=1 Tax=Micrurus lemniscatus lemniscatus TaxID=129467 RepID=A0A2D4H9H8_MICLE